MTMRFKVTIAGADHTFMVEEHKEDDRYGIVAVTDVGNQNAMRWAIAKLVTTYDCDFYALRVTHDPVRERWLLLVYTSPCWPGRSAYYAGILRAEKRLSRRKVTVVA